MSKEKKPTKNTKEKSKEKTKSKVQKVTKEKKVSPIEEAKTQAIGIIDSMSKSDVGFGNSWRVFTTKIEATLESFNKFQKIVEQKKEETLAKRNEALESMKHIIPKLKDKLGKEGSKNRIAYIIGANIEVGSINIIRRLLDRYEEMYGRIYPPALEDKSDSEITDTESEGRHIDIMTSIFGKGQDEMVEFFNQVIEAANDGTFDRIQIFLTNRDRIKGMRLVKK